jgi:hypothetical protein
MERQTQSSINNANQCERCVLKIHGIYEKRAVFCRCSSYLPCAASRIVKLEEEVLTLTRDKRRADDRIEELERGMAFKVEVIFHEPFYWVKGDRVPFCPACCEGKNKIVHVVYNDSNNNGEFWGCKTCGADFWTNGARGRESNYWDRA